MDRPSAVQINQFEEFEKIFIFIQKQKSQKMLYFIKKNEFLKLFITLEKLKIFQPFKRKKYFLCLHERFSV